MIAFDEWDVKGWERKKKERKDGWFWAAAVPAHPLRSDLFSATLHFPPSVSSEATWNSNTFPSSQVTHNTTQHNTTQQHQLPLSFFSQTHKTITSSNLKHTTQHNFSFLSFIIIFIVIIIEEERRSGQKTKSQETLPPSIVLFKC